MDSTTYRGRVGASSTPLSEARQRFMVRTYNTLFAAIVAFALVEVGLFQLGLALPIAQALGSNWLLTLGGFMLVSWFGSRTAANTQNQAAAYGALGLFVVAEALIFTPLLFMANQFAPGAISSAGMVTLLGFAGLTGIVWKTKKDFSFLRGVLMWGGIVALVLIGAGLVFGFQLGTFFSVAMVGFAGAAILYDTSNILHHYPTDRHVSAALSLFSSVALMFWYVLRLFIGARD